MKDEKDLIQKLTLFKEIKPRESWVLFAKNQILEQNNAELNAEPRGSWALLNQVKQLSYLRIPSGIKVLPAGRFLYFEKPAYVFAALAFVVLGGVGYQISQNSLPGDALYSVRSVIEKATISSDPLASVGVAQRRLEDLRKVVEENRVKNLVSATQEFNHSVVEASKGLLELVENEPDKALQASRELVQLQKGKAQIEQILGVAIGGEEVAELESATKILVEAELNDLVERTLTADQEDLLEQAIVAYQAGNYETALEHIWSISN